MTSGVIPGDHLVYRFSSDISINHQQSTKGMVPVALGLNGELNCSANKLFIICVGRIQIASADLLLEVTYSHRCIVIQGTWRWL